MHTHSKRVRVELSEPDGPEELNCDTVMGLWEAAVRWHTLAAACLCAETVAFREKVDKTLGQTKFWGGKKAELMMLHIFLFVSFKYI